MGGPKKEQRASQLDETLFMSVPRTTYKHQVFVAVTCRSDNLQLKASVCQQLAFSAKVNAENHFYALDRVEAGGHKYLALAVLC